MPIRPFPSFLKGNAYGAYGAYGAYEGSRLSDPLPIAQSPGASLGFAALWSCTRDQATVVGGLGLFGLLLFVAHLCLET
jgi:hypothetical protein